jgi:pSer/pThr/pTyr-binding forkhead associated (FHA) protein
MTAMRLELLSGPLAGMQVDASGTLTVGREPGCTLLLDDLKVSRRHATLFGEHGRLSIIDTGSRNGTWVNDERIASPRALRDGDRVRIGGSEMRVVAGPPAVPTLETLLAEGNTTPQHLTIADPGALVRGREE